MKTHQMYFGLVNDPNIPVGETVNTFRVGSKWFDAVSPGDRIKLIHTPTGESFGEAIVRSAFLGTWHEMKEHSDRNQTWRHYPRETGQDSLLLELARVYPEITVTSEVSVIYFERVS